MRHGEWLYRVPWRALLLVAALSACSNTTAAPSVDATLDHGTIGSVADAVIQPETGFDAPPLQASIRVALLAPIATGVDVCVTSVTTGMVQGPLLYERKQLPSLPDAGHDAPLPDAPSGDATHADATGDATRDAATGDAGRAVDGASDASSDADEAGLDAMDSSSDVGVDAGSGADASVDASLDAVLDVAAEAEAGVADAGTDAAVVPLDYMSNYLTVEGAGTFDVAIVAGGSSACGCPLVQQRVTLDPGKFYTLLVLSTPLSAARDASASDATTRLDGSKTDATLADATVADATVSDGAARDATAKDAPELDAARDAPSGDAARADASIAPCPDAAVEALSVVSLTDEPSASSALARARFFNATTVVLGAAPDAGFPDALRVIALDSTSKVPLAIDVPAGHVANTNADNPGIDTLGYWSGSPLSSMADLRIGALLPDAGTTEAGVGSPVWTFAPPVSAGSFNLLAGTNHTGIIVGGEPSPVRLLWCDDTTEMPTNVFASCVQVVGN